MDHGGMDHGSHDMGGPSPTEGIAAAATSMAASASMGMGHGGSTGCKISMLWNWYTVDSCFISSTWRVSTPGMFAGSCIGVILLVMTLEGLRRAVKEYDRFLVRKYAERRAACGRPAVVAVGAPEKTGSSEDVAAVDSSKMPAEGYRPSVFEQAVRALLHMVQFAVAYFIMLLAMYYNGYIIICIFIGAYLGAFVFQWETLGCGPNTSAAQEATVCCG